MKAQKLTIAQARQAINALRDGVPPPGAVSAWLTIGQPDIRVRFREGLQIIANGGFQPYLLVGAPGAGKSHLLSYLCTLAAQGNCLVSYCSQDISAGATLNRPDLCYRKLMKNLCLPENPDGRSDPLTCVLQAWAEKALPHVQYQPPIMGRVYPLANAGLIPPLNLLPRRSGLALVGYLLALEANSLAAQEMMVNVFRGLNVENREVIETAKQVGLTYAQIGYTPSPYDADYWLGQFSTLCHLTRIAGYTGTVLLLDELESLVDLTFSSSRRKAYSVLHALLFNEHQAQGLFTVFAFTPAFVTGLKTDFRAAGHAYHHDWGELWSKAYSEIRALSVADAHELTRKIAHLHAISYPQNSKPAISVDLAALVNDWSKAKLPVGDLVRRTVSVLDQSVSI